MSKCPNNQNNQRLAWNDHHVLRMLQEAKKFSYTHYLENSSKKRLIFVMPKLHRSLKKIPVLSKYSQRQIRNKLQQLRVSVQKYLNGTRSEMIEKRPYYNLALEMFGDGRKVPSKYVNVTVEAPEIPRTADTFQYPNDGICRSCRSTNIEDAVDLYNDQYEGQSYAEILTSVLSIELLNMYGVSRKICVRCAKIIESLVAFVSQCQESNGILRITKMDSWDDAVKQEEVNATSGLGDEQYAYEDIKIEQLIDESQPSQLETIQNDDKNIETLNASLSSKEEMEFQIASVDHSVQEESNSYSKFNDFECKSLVNESQTSESQRLDCTEEGPCKEKQMVGSGRGRGPNWKKSDLKMLLLTAKKYQREDGSINYGGLYRALRDIPGLSHISSSGIRSQLYKVRMALKEPGMPRIIGQIYERAALELYSHFIEFDRFEHISEAEDSNLTAPFESEDCVDDGTDKATEQEPSDLKAESSPNPPATITQKRSGRGPAWKSSDLKMLLEEAKKYQSLEGKINEHDLFIGLKKHPSLAYYTRAAIHAQLQKVRRLVKEPGTPKLDKNMIEIAIDLFAHDSEPSTTHESIFLVVDDEHSDLFKAEEPEFTSQNLSYSDESAHEQKQEQACNNSTEGKWKPLLVKLLLEEAKKYQNADGFIDIVALHAALQQTSLRSYSQKAIHRKLHNVKKLCEEPGMPRILGEVYAKEAAAIYPGVSESSADSDFIYVKVHCTGTSGSDSEDVGEMSKVDLSCRTKTRKYRLVGRGPNWNSADLNLLLLEALKFRNDNGIIGLNKLMEALKEYPTIRHHSMTAIKSKLHAVRRLVEQPGMPKIKNTVYAATAISLFGSHSETKISLHY